MRRRIINAIESGHPDAEPSRRARAVVVGVVATLLTLAAVVARHYTDRPARWLRSDAVIVERDTGAKFVYIDDVLHPMTNYVSARLALGLAAPNLVTVSRSDLQAATLND